MSAPFLGDRRAILFSNNLQYEVCHIWCCFINIRWITWNKSIICDWISSIEKRNIVSERPSSKCIEWNIARRLSVTSSCKISSEKLSCIWMITVIDYIKVMIVWDTDSWLHVDDTKVETFVFIVSKLAGWSPCNLILCNTCSATSCNCFV